jgi:hypothetical protein
MSGFTLLGSQGSYKKYVSDVCFWHFGPHFSVYTKDAASVNENHHAAMLLELTAMKSHT